MPGRRTEWYRNTCFAKRKSALLCCRTHRRKGSDATPACQSHSLNVGATQLMFPCDRDIVLEVLRIRPS
jgi:hypothetical protein